MKKSLREVRQGFVTKLTVKRRLDEPAPTPPAGVLDLVKYPSPAGDLAAYVSYPPTGGAKRPAIVWLVGGFDSSIDENFWTPAPASNDQSASVFRQEGVLVMYPSLRGGNDNPGFMESFYGEVDDVLAARAWLAKQPFVDPDRIYLGGHSTGGTLALLTAECAARGDFRGVFAFGPAASAVNYGQEELTFDVHQRDEALRRAPLLWLKDIACPTFVFEGTEGGSNIRALETLQKANLNPAVHFHPLPGVDHFGGLQPISRLIAQKILRDSAPAASLTFTAPELAAAISSTRRQE